MADQKSNIERFIWRLGQIKIKKPPKQGKP